MWWVARNPRAYLNDHDLVTWTITLIQLLAHNYALHKYALQKFQHGNTSKWVPYFGLDASPGFHLPETR
jgi:hypothetical protein